MILNVGLFLIICLFITSAINNITIGVEMEMILFFNKTENVQATHPNKPQKAKFTNTNDRT